MGQGSGAAETQAETQGLLQEFVDYIKVSGLGREREQAIVPSSGMLLIGSQEGGLGSNADGYICMILFMCGWGMWSSWSV